MSLRRSFASRLRKLLAFSGRSLPVRKFRRPNDTLNKRPWHIFRGSVELMPTYRGTLCSDRVFACSRNGGKVGNKGSQRHRGKRRGFRSSSRGQTPAVSGKEPLRAKQRKRSLCFLLFCPVPRYTSSFSCSVRGELRNRNANSSIFDEATRTKKTPRLGVR